jgi:hypothetical protein
MFATLPSIGRWVEEVAGLADEHKIGAFFGWRAVRIVGVVAGLVAVVVLLFVVLNWYVGPKTPSVRKDLVVAVAQILAGTALLSGLYFTWRTLQVNREGQITERFTRAIDQLGNESEDVRLGGIYALERISRESQEDHWPIMEILTAYVRQHAYWLGEVVWEGAKGDGEPSYGAEGHSDAPLESESPDVTYPASVTVQAVMTVLRRRTRSFRHGEPEPLDLRGTRLVETNLQGANLQGANLHRANLHRANLQGANLRSVNLSGAILTQEQLEETRSGDENTRLPSHLKPPAHWGVKTDEQSEGG